MTAKQFVYRGRVVVEGLAVAGGGALGYTLGSGRFAITLLTGLAAGFLMHLVLRRFRHRRGSAP